MSSLAQLRTAIKDTLVANITGVNVYEYVPETIEFPAIIVQPRTGGDGLFAEFDQAFQRGHDCYYFDLVVVVSRTDAQERQAELDAFLTGAGSKSVRQVFHNNGEILPDSDSMIMLASHYGQFPAGNLQGNYGAVLRLKVITDGDS